MRSRLELPPYQRFLWTVIAVGLLVWGWGGKGRIGPGRFLGTLAVVGLILYAAGGGRVPWKINWKDYILYIVISVSLVVAIVGYAFLQAHKGH
jgi:hypothetical protein